MLDEVRCTGTEPSLANCSSLGWMRSNCRHDKDASVICTNGEQGGAEWGGGVPHPGPQRPGLDPRDGGQAGSPAPCESHTYLRKGSQVMPALQEGRESLQFPPPRSKGCPLPPPSP